MAFARTLIINKQLLIVGCQRASQINAGILLWRSCCPSDGRLAGFLLVFLVFEQQVLGVRRKLVPS
jgi:hypothetical protein